MFGALDRRLVFDVNDFDETLPGPFEWDVKRLAASVAVAARDNGLDARAERTAARRCAHVYRTEMDNFARMRFLDVWYSRIDVDQVSRAIRRGADGQGRPAAQRGHPQGVPAHQRAGAGQAVPPGGRASTGSSRAPPVVVRFGIEHEPAIAVELRGAIDRYEETIQADRRRCCAATTSATSPARWSASARSAPRRTSSCCSATGRTSRCSCSSRRRQQSVLAPFAGPSEYKHQGERVVRGRG